MVVGDKSDSGSGHISYEATKLLHVTHARLHTLVVTGDKSDHGAGHVSYFMQQK